MKQYTLQQRINGAFKLAHPALSLLGSLYVFVGAYLVGGLTALTTSRAPLAALVAALIVSYAFIINDYHDLPVDLQNKKGRPLPAGLVRPREAVIMMAVLVLLALTLTIWLPGWLRLLVALNILLSAAYSYHLKDTLLIGNATIAYLNASTILFGALAVGQLTATVWVGFALIFLFVMAQEVLFAAKDYEGDEAANLRTTANRLGKRAALNLFKALAILFAATTLAPAIMGWSAMTYLYAAIPLTVIPILSTVVLLSWRQTPKAIWLATRVIVFLWGSSAIPLVLLGVS